MRKKRFRMHYEPPFKARVALAALAGRSRDAEALHDRADQRDARAQEYGHKAAKLRDELAELDRQEADVRERMLEPKAIVAWTPLAS